jgi:hypothetical protein
VLLLARLTPHHAHERLGRRTKPPRHLEPEIAYGVESAHRDRAIVIA